VVVVFLVESIRVTCWKEEECVVASYNFFFLRIGCDFIFCKKQRQRWVFFLKLRLGLSFSLLIFVRVLFLLSYFVHFFALLWILLISH